jgi:phage protein D
VTAATQMIAGVEVAVNGSPLGDDLTRRMTEVRVDDNLMLPDAFLVRLADPELRAIGGGPFEVGAEVEIKLASDDARSLVSVLKGQVTTLEPEFGEAGAVLCARGYDHSHKLHRVPRTQTYQQMTAADIVRRVAARAGIGTGAIKDAGPVNDFVQQTQETDWAFLWRLASAIDFEVLVADAKLHFRPAGPSTDAPIGLRWGQKLLTFRPRITGVQQVDEVVVRGWDITRQAKIESSARSPQPDSQPRLTRASVAAALGGGTVTVGDRPVTSQREADGLAKSIAARLANAAVEAEGTALGNPALRSGARVDIDGVGRFGGIHTLSSTSHVVRGAQGYRTHFVISGRSARSLLELMSPPARRGWGRPLAVGVVTQNEDPDRLGRVRVNYPALGDDTEGWWARVATPAAGDSRGLLMLPVPGEEVVVGFEHEDTRRPIVLGSVFGGAQRPGELAHKDGSFAVHSDKQAVVAAKQDVKISSEAGVTVSAKQDLKHEADGAAGLKGRSVTVEATGGAVKISGATELKLECGGASITLGAAGTVQVSGTMIELG